MKHIYEHSRETLSLATTFEALSDGGQKIQLNESDFIKLVDYFELEESFSRALEVNDLGIFCHKFSPKLHTRKARLLIENKREELGMESLDRAEIFGQSFIETDTLRARAHYSLGNYAAAFELLDDLKINYFISRKDRSLVYLEEALLYEKREEYQAMYIALRSALEYNPHNQIALQRIWVAVEITKNYHESIEIHNKVIDANPYSFLAWYNLGHAYYSLREYKDAIEAFEYAFITNEKFESAYTNFAEVCFHLQKYNKAIDALEEALPFFQSNSELLLKIGQAYEYKGDFAKAKIYLYRALNIESESNDIYHHLGECYLREGEYRSAIHFFKQAIKFEEEIREDSLIGLATAYANTGNYQKALPLFQQAMDAGPEVAKNWIEYTRFLVTIEAMDEAMETIEQAEETAYCPEILYCKAALLFKINDRKNALYYLGEALCECSRSQNIFFSFIPEIKNDKDVKAIFRYYNEAEV